MARAGGGVMVFDSKMTNAEILDRMKFIVGIQSDQKLAHELDISPAQISRTRSGVHGISPRIFIRFMLYAEFTPSDMMNAGISYGTLWG